MKRIYVSDISNLPTKKNPSMSVKNNANNERKFILLAGKSFLLGAFIILAIYGIFYVWSQSISTNEVYPETFTELYFDDNLQLPSQVIPKHLYIFQFTLHNLEGKDMDYPYEVYIQSGQDKKIFDQGTVLVKVNSYNTIQERFATSNILPKSQIVVVLINKNQQIDFWISGARELVNLMSRNYTYRMANAI